jgi:CheY-like chemotaxis protein
MSGRRVVTVVPDLFFAARIAEVARTLGVTLVECDASQAPARCREQPTGLVVLDLTAGERPLALARALKAEEETRAIRIVGFYSHVEEALRAAALAAGVDEVLPRSAFTRRLPEILGAPGPGAA